MNTKDKEFYKQELQHVRNLMTNIRNAMMKETSPADSSQRMNHDARMHQISGIIRHIGYLETYIEESKIMEK